MPGGGTDNPEIREQVIIEHLRKTVKNYDNLSFNDQAALKKKWLLKLTKFPQEEANRQKQTEQDVADNVQRIFAEPSADSRLAEEKVRLREDSQSRRMLEEIGERSQYEDKAVKSILHDIKNRLYQGGIYQGGNFAEIADDAIEKHVIFEINEKVISSEDKQKRENEWKEKLNRYQEINSEFDEKQTHESLSEDVRDEFCREEPLSEQFREPKSEKGQIVRCGIIPKIHKNSKALAVVGALTTLGALSYTPVHAALVSAGLWSGTSLGVSFAATTIAGVSMAAVAPATVGIVGFATAVYGLKKYYDRKQQNSGGKITPQQGRNLLAVSKEKIRDIPRQIRSKTTNLLNRLKAGLTK